MKEIQKDQLIIGVHAVREVLMHAPNRLIEIYSEKGKGERKSSLAALAQEKGIPITFLPNKVLTKMAGTEFHQSFVAHVKARAYLSAKEFVEKAPDNALVLMLDQIFDPQNFGAILRSAECFGVDGVIWSKNRGADLTPIATKTSSGASELLPLIRVSNLVDAAQKFKKGGFEIVTTLADRSAKSLFDFKFSPKTVLILGSEGEGIQPLLQKQGDRSLFIPMFGKIESLNVAQAASVILSQYRS